MTAALTLRQRRELHEVATIAPKQPTRLVDGMVWDQFNNAASHATSENFLQRQIKRGLVPRERKE